MTRGPIILLSLTALLMTPSAHADRLAEFANLLTGTFDTHARGEPRGEQSRLIDRHVRIDAPEVGALVMYLQLNSGDELALYRQRVLVFELDGDVIVQRAHQIADAERFVDLDEASAAEVSLTADDIKRMFESGCAQRWRYANGQYSGYTDPATCRIISSRTGKPRRIEAESLLSVEGLAVTERGYDDEMNQLFGSAPGDMTMMFRVPD